MTQHDNEIPSVIAIQKGNHYVIKCPYCQKEHRHGAGDGSADSLGHRVAHCHKGMGYNLVREIKT